MPAAIRGQERALSWKTERDGSVRALCCKLPCPGGTGTAPLLTELGHEMPPGEPHWCLPLFPSFSQARAGWLHVQEESEFQSSRSKNLAVDSPRGSMRRAVPLAGCCSRGPAHASPSPAGDKAAGLSPLCQGALVGARCKGGFCAVSPAKPGAGPRAMTPRWRAALLTDARVGLNPRLPSEAGRTGFRWRGAGGAWLLPCRTCCGKPAAPASAPAPSVPGPGGTSLPRGAVCGTVCLRSGRSWFGF